MSSVYRPVSGTVRLDDEVVLGQPPHRIAAAGVGRSFQNVDVSGDETVLESVLGGRDAAHADAIAPANVVVFAIPNSALVASRVPADRFVAAFVNPLAV